jgi:hypothetical protein
MNRQKEFQQKLLKLLWEYGVEVSVKEATEGWYVYDGINFYSAPTWDGVELIHEGFDFTWPKNSNNWS